MSTQRKVKRNLFTVLGWLVWKIAAVFGSKYARRKLDERQEHLQGSGISGRVRRAASRRKR